jgi:hypothetical protein
VGALARRRTPGGPARLGGHGSGLAERVDRRHRLGGRRRLLRRLVPADLPQGGVDLDDGLRAGRLLPRGHEGADGRFAGAPLQRQDGMWTDNGARAVAAGPSPAMGEGVDDLGLAESAV